MKRTAIIVFGLLLLGVLASSASAYPSYFNNRCASCHSNDNPTCNGCHQHGPVGLDAQLDASSYTPGAPVTVTLDGGTKSGWVRALLYDENNLVVALATGPTGMGDDSQPGAVTLPVDLVATAPATPGDHAWQAAWFGGEVQGGGHHSEVRVGLVVRVGATAVASSSWSQIHALY